MSASKSRAHRESFQIPEFVSDDHPRCSEEAFHPKLHGPGKVSSPNSDDEADGKRERIPRKSCGRNPKRLFG